VGELRILLVPSFTELEWGFLAELEEWAEVATFDTPGVGGEPVPAGVDPAAMRASELLSAWREATVDRGLAEVDRRGWSSFVLVSDSHGTPTAVRLARRRRDLILGLAIGHASLSHSAEGDRAPMRGGIWEAMTMLARQGSDAFVRHGIAQMTRGGVSEELAAQMVERFPDTRFASAMVEALGHEPEPIGDDLDALDLPLLLAKHEGCLGRTDEGFEDIVAAFPDARTVICPETCSSSTAFADALHSFCRELATEP
jgi:hypothetical protein